MNLHCSHSLRASQVIHYGTVVAVASELLQHARMPDSGEAFPLTNDEVRRRRLKQLVSLTPGGIAVIAEKAKVSAQNLDHILKRRRQKARADGSQPLVMMGDKLARDIEQAFGLSAGWLDWPFVHVDYDAFAALGASGRALVQGQMIAAVKEAAKLPDVVHQADRKPVTNEKVEEHFPSLTEDEIKSAHARAHKRPARVVVDPKSPALRQRPLIPDE